MVTMSQKSSVPQPPISVSQALMPDRLESENAKLKKLLADAMLDNEALKDLLAKKW
jgi:putative transposase